jgi:hypothetical protein
MSSKFWLENLNERSHSEDLDTNGRMILKRILGNRIWVKDWIHLVQNRDRWRTLVNTVSKF